MDISFINIKTCDKYEEPSVKEQIKTLVEENKNVIFRIILRKWKYKNFNFTAIFLFFFEGGEGGMGGEIK